MNFPYAAFVRWKHDPRTNVAVCFAQKPRVGSRITPSNARPLSNPHAIGTSPSLLWARTWQKQGRIQFIRPPLGLILPASLTQPFLGRNRPLVAAPGAGRIAPGAAARSLGRLLGIAPRSMRRPRRGVVLPPPPLSVPASP